MPSVEDDPREALVLVAEIRPGASGVAAQLAIRGLVTLAVRLGQLQLVWYLPKLCDTTSTSTEGDPTRLGLLALEVHRDDTSSGGYAWRKLEKPRFLPVIVSSNSPTAVKAQRTPPSKPAMRLPSGRASLHVSGCHTLSD